MIIIIHRRNSFFRVSHFLLFIKVSLSHLTSLISFLIDFPNVPGSSTHLNSIKTFLSTRAIDAAIEFIITV